MARLAQELRDAVIQAAIEGKLTHSPETSCDDLDNCDSLGKSNHTVELFGIPDNWQWSSFGQATDMLSGYAFKSSDFKKRGSYRLLRGINLGVDSIRWDDTVFVDEMPEKLISYKLMNGDVLLGLDRPWISEGIRVSIFDGPDNTYLVQRVLRIRETDSLINRYIAILLRSSLLENTVGNNTTGISVPHISQKQVEKVLIPIPPIEEQQRIIDRVDELMIKIDEFEAIENELETLKMVFPGEMKKALLQAAMEGKLTEQISDENIDDILSELVMDPKLKKTGEPPFDIPDNWRWIQVGNLGKSLGTDSFSDGPFGSNLKREHQINNPEVRIIQLSNIGEDGWKDDNEKYTSFDHLEKVIPRCEVFPGCLVIAKMMPAGRTIEVPDLGTRITLGSDAMKFDPNPVLNKRYLLYAMRSNAFLGQVYSGVHGITRVRTTLKGVKSYILPIPPIKEQQRIVDCLDSLLPLCDELEVLS